MANSIAYYPLLNALDPYVTLRFAPASLNLVFGTARGNVQARLKRTAGCPDVMSFVERGDCGWERDAYYGAGGSITLFS